MEKVTIEMDWHDAVVMMNRLKTRKKQDEDFLGLIVRTEGRKPSWLVEEIETLSRIIDIVEKAVHIR